MLALGALLSGCGGGAARRTQSVATATRASGASRGGAPTRSQALAFARAVNLTAADVPGFAASRGRESESAHERELQRGLRQCAGPTPFGPGVADAQSPAFKLKQDVLDLGVSSEVSVAQSSTQAKRELAAIRGQRIKGCFTRYLDLLLQSQRTGGVQLTPVSILTGTPPAPGAIGSFGWRITATFVASQIRLSLYVDILGFVVGPARVTLVSSGALRPFPAAIQQRLYTLLLARARSTAL